MILVISGGRDYEFTQADIDYLDTLLPRVTMVVHGGARGADSWADAWAKENCIPVETFEPEWDVWGGKVAPLKRNVEMAEVAQIAVIFPGGNGTNHMHSQAVKHGLEIHDRRGMR